MSKGGKYGGSLAAAIADNQTRQCKHPGCRNKRVRISGYCAGHSSQHHRYGSSFGMIRKKELDGERTEVRELIELNQSTHKGIQFALKFLEKWLEDSWAGKDVVCAHHFRRIYDNGVTALDILVEACSVWLFANRYPRRIRTDRHLTYALGHRLLRGRTYWGIILGPEARETGEHLRKNIGVLLVTVARAVVKREQEHDAKVKMLSQPLITTGKAENETGNEGENEAENQGGDDRD